MGGQVLELAPDRLVEESIQKGIVQGAALERESSIRTLIHFSHKNNIPRDNLIQQLTTEYHLSDDQVQQLIARYWE